MLERLWASWRSDYVRSIDDSNEHAFTTGDGATLFEGILAAGLSDEEAGVVHRGELVSVILNAYPYGSGHVLVVPNRGVARLGDLTAEESRTLWDTVDRAVAVCEAEYECPGVNVGLNQGKAAGAGVPDHLHVHVLPRWLGDTNFMTAIAETRVLPESLDESGRRLRARWGQVPYR